MTQTDLASRAGISLPTIAVVESQVETTRRKWTKRNALQVLKALHAVSPVDRESALEFLDYFELEHSFYDSLSQGTPAPPPAQAPRSAGGDIGAALEAFSLLLDRHGTARATELIRALLDDPAPERILRIGPRPSPTVPGAIEETTVIERRLNSAAAIKRATKDARRQSK